MQKPPEQMTDNRPCTCHPDEAPVPCQRKFAFSECVAAANATQTTEAACRDHPTVPGRSDEEREAAIREIFGWRPDKEWDQTFLLRLLDKARREEA